MTRAWDDDAIPSSVILPMMKRTAEPTLFDRPSTQIGAEMAAAGVEHGHASIFISKGDQSLVEPIDRVGTTSDVA
jgi:hypothetical protein